MIKDAQNPLMTPFDLPPFSQIKPEHVLPAITSITEANLKALSAQLGDLGEPTWQNLMLPLEEREDLLSQAWSPVSHLNSVANNPQLREAFEQCLGVLSAYNTAMGQNQALFEAYMTLAKSEAFKGFSAAQQQAINNAIRDFKLAGVALNSEDKKRYAEIQAELSSLTNQFSNNVLDATQGWFKHISSEDDLAGLPEQAVIAAKKMADNKKLDGWVLTLDGPVYVTVMTQAHNRELRREMYTAYMTKASDQGPTAGRWNNNDLMQRILELRTELAKLLGFEHYSALSIAPKMAESTEQVLSFLEELAQKTKPFAERELAELNRWAQENYEINTLEVWDVPFYSERLKEAKYQTSQEALRPYFPMSKVQAGLFALVERLFGVTIEKQTLFDTWHPDAEFFCIKRAGEAIAYFYLDAYAREGKRGGAWMGECRVRRQLPTHTQLPVAYLVCNFNAPVDDTPCLLTHSEVTTLFHEFGHGLHHMLTAVDVASVSGINGVAWDAVELPSQFMENWCWEPEVLKTLSSHYRTGDVLPETEINKLLNAKNFQSAMMMLRQLEFAIFDLRLHKEFSQSTFPGIQALLDEVRSQTAVLIPPAFNRFQNSFTHIFAGGYAAGYYSYKWAEVLSADAFAAFEEEGLFDANVGKRFLTEILQKGGSENAMELFKNFRGREPSVDALMRHSGLQNARA